MKPLSVAELQNLALELKTLEGARLQEVRLSAPLLLLGFYLGGDLRWVIFDLNPLAPQVVGAEDISRLRVKDEKKPIGLFLKAHFVDLRLAEILAPLDLGRVLIFKFGRDTSRDQAELEVRLFPRGPNVLVRAQGKELALAKPMPLKTLETAPEWNGQETEGLLAAKSAEWLAARLGPEKDRTSGSTRPSAEENSKAEAKILKAMAKVTADLDLKRDQRWAEAGEWLKTHGFAVADFIAGAPDDLKKYFDAKKNRAWNLENCFAKSKDLKEKILGTEKRLRELQGDLDKIRSGQNIAVKKVENRSSAAARAAAEDVKGRTYELGDGIIFFVGKSAQDNLRLLRSAKAWDLWLHLRDVPSCHGILRRNKNQNVSETQLHQAAHHLIAKNFGEKHANYEGERFDVLMAECRFVRPIKGDKAGRVSYSDERVFAHRYAKKS